MTWWRIHIFKVVVTWHDNWFDGTGLNCFSEQRSTPPIGACLASPPGFLMGYLAFNLKEFMNYHLCDHLYYLEHSFFRLVACLPMEHLALASPRCERRNLVFQRPTHIDLMFRWPTHIDLNFDSTHNNKVKELLHEVVSKLEVIIGNCYWTPSWYKIQGCAWRASGDGQKPSDPSSRLPEQVSSTDHPSVRLPVFSSVRLSVCLSVRSFQSLCSILLFATVTAIVSASC